MDEIRELYNQLRPKGDFVKAAAKRFGLSPTTIRIHWVSCDSIPKEKQEEVKELLQHILKEQKKYAKNIGL